MDKSLVKKLKDIWKNINQATIEFAENIPQGRWSQNLLLLCLSTRGGKPIFLLNSLFLDNVQI